MPALGELGDLCACQTSAVDWRDFETPRGTECLQHLLLKLFGLALSELSPSPEAPDAARLAKRSAQFFDVGAERLSRSAITARGEASEPRPGPEGVQMVPAGSG